MKIGIKNLLISLIIITLCCSGCGKQVEVLPEAITIILNSNEIYSAKINRLGNYSKYELDGEYWKKHIDEIEESEVEAYMKSQVESFSQLVEIQDRMIVQKGDVVVVSYMVQRNGKIVNQITSDVLLVGSNSYDQQFEKALVGKKIKEPFLEELIAPNGEKMLFNITVESINYFETYELTDQFVQNKLGFNSVEDYYNNCEKYLLDEKIQVEKERARTNLLEKIMSRCEFSLENEEIARFSLQFVETEKNLADVYELDLESYINTALNISKEEFFQYCYEQGEFEIKKCLLVGAIFSDLHYSITEEEKESMCEQFGYDYCNVLKDEYTNAVVEFTVMEQKVWDYFEQ